MSEHKSPVHLLRRNLALYEAVQDLTLRSLHASTLADIGQILATRIKYIADVRISRLLLAAQPDKTAAPDDTREVASITQGRTQVHSEYFELRALPPGARDLFFLRRIGTWKPASPEDLWTQDDGGSGELDTLTWCPSRDGETFFGGWLVRSERALTDTDLRFLCTALQVTGATVAGLLLQRSHERALTSRMEAMRTLIRDISTVICPIAAGILFMPIVGPLDEARTVLLSEAILDRVQADRARLVIVDMTGMSRFSERGIESLFSSMRAVKLLGARVVIVGLRPLAAQTLAARQGGHEALCFRQNLGEVLADRAMGALLDR